MEKQNCHLIVPLVLKYQKEQVKDIAINFLKKIKNKRLLNKQTEKLGNTEMSPVTSLFYYYNI